MTSKKKFLTEGYNVSIVGKNVQVTEAMKNYLLERLSKVDRFTDNVLDMMVVLEKQRVSNTVSIVMKFWHINIKVHATTEEMYSSIDKAVEKLIALINKYKGKLLEHRVKDWVVADIKENVISLPKNEVDEINEEIEFENRKREEKKYSIPKVVATERRSLKTLSQEEAIMKMDLTGQSFLLYRDEKDRKLKVMYKRDNDELGVIEVE